MSKRKEEIMEAAIDIFAKKGYFNSHVAEIVEKVGIAKGTFYLYYNSKKDIFLTMINRYEELLVKNIDFARLNDNDLDLEDKIAAVIEDFLFMYLNNYKLTSIILREAVSIDDDFFEELKNINFSYEKIFKNIYNILVNNNNISPENDLDIFINLFQGVLNNYLLRNIIINKEEIDIELKSKEIAEYLSRSLIK